MVDQVELNILGRNKGLFYIDNNLQESIFCFSALTKH